MFFYFTSIYKLFIQLYVFLFYINILYAYNCGMLNFVYFNTFWLMFLCLGLIESPYLVPHILDLLLYDGPGAWDSENPVQKERFEHLPIMMPWSISKLHRTWAGCLTYWVDFGMEVKSSRNHSKYVIRRGTVNIFVITKSHWKNLQPNLEKGIGWDNGWPVYFIPAINDLQVEDLLN